MTEVLSAMPPMPTFPHPPSSQSSRMHEMPQFAFPIRAMDQEEKENVLPNSRLELPSVQLNKSHRRARTSVNVTAPLPSFSFGGPTPASATSSASSTPSSAQPTTEQSLSPSTPPSRHRRAVSEFGGGNSQPDVAQLPSSRPIPAMAPPHMAHRHRRSGAVDSQDLSYLRIGRSLGTEQDNSATLTSGLSASNNADSPSDASPSSAQGSPQSSSRSVTFSDVVTRHNPRSTSVVSSESNGSQSTMRESAVTGTTPSPVFSSFNTSPPPPSLASEPDDDDVSSDPFMSSGVYQESGTGVGIVELDQNFDHDPTEAVSGALETGPYEAHDHDILTETSASPSKDKSSPTVNPSSPEIDLDFASLDYKPAAATPAIRGVSFQKARASMHSAGSQSGTLASSLGSHRRTESAPSLSMSPFESRSVDNAAEAGFEMTAVFEEDEEEDDEEDEDLDKTPLATPVVEDTSKADLGSAEQEITPTPLTGQRDIHTSPSLLPPFQYILTRSVSYDGSELGRKSAESSLSRAQSSLVTLEDQSVSAKSSPRYAQSGISSLEPSPSTFHRSVDDVPSLISSGSTIGETTLANPSIRSLEPNVAVTGSTTSLAPVRPRHRKRHSVMSMSGMSMSVSRFFSNTSSQSGELDAHAASRSQSTAGLEPPKPSKARRVMQKLGLSKKRIS